VSRSDAAGVKFSLRSTDSVGRAFMALVNARRRSTKSPSPCDQAVEGRASPSWDDGATPDVGRRASRAKTSINARNTMVSIPGATYFEFEALVRLMAEASDTEL